MATQTDSTRGRLTTYFKGVRAEMRKVVWPSRKELLNHTGIVIAISLIVSVIVYLLDLGIHGVLQLIL